MMENQALEVLKTRRSVRKYSEKMVEQEKLDLIMEAATYAPTGMGKQSPVIVLIKDKETRDLVSKLNARVMGGENDPFYGAPVVAVVFGHKGQIHRIYQIKEPRRDRPATLDQLASQVLLLRFSRNPFRIPS